MVNLLLMESNKNVLQKESLAAFEKNHASISDAIATSNYLAGGKLGLVLYYFSLYEALGETGHANKCISLLEEVMDQEDDVTAPLAGTSFSIGTAGLGYILAVLQKSDLVEINLKEDLRELDDSMAGIAMKQIVEEDRNDYLHGAMGVIHYFTLRSKELHIRKHLVELVEAFCKKAVVTENGLWFRNFIIDKKEKDRIDTGLSHGNAGFLLILLNVLQAGIHEKSLKKVIVQGVQFLLSQQMDTFPEDEQHAFFPFSIHSNNNNDKYFSQRLAWCYGDLNIILLLYRGAALLNEPGWEELADTLAEQTVKRMDETATLATDSHFCHGTSGLAHFYQTLYAISGNKIFDNAADYWIGQTLNLLDEEWKQHWYSDKECDLLNGLPGVNLVLLSYISKKELAWSRSLLL